MQKNDSVKADIVELSFEGLGVAKIDGRTVFVYDALPNEKVKANVMAVKKRHAFAKVSEVLSASPDRVKPPCAYFPKCGGCVLQHMTYAKELAFKKEWFARAFAEEGITLAEIPLQTPFTVQPSDTEYGYRNKCSLPIRSGKGGSVQVGFFRKKSHEVIDISECLLQLPSIAELLTVLKDWINGELGGKKIEPYHEETHSGNLRHIALRVIGGKAVVCVVGTAAAHTIDFSAFSQALANLFNGNFALYYNRNPDKTNVIFGKEFTLIAGEDTPIAVDGLLLRVHPAGFFQVNDNVRQKLFAAVQAAVQKTKPHTVIEAYAGQGVLAAKLSNLAQKLYGIEICPESIESGIEMTRLNGINNLHFVAGDCGVELGKLLKRLHEPFLILDPPRGGLCEKALGAVLKNRPKDILYISCNPVSLARDIAVWLPHYRLAHLEAFDMFPKTLNVETLAVLERIEK